MKLLKYVLKVLLGLCASLAIFMEIYIKKIDILIMEKTNALNAVNNFQNSHLVML